jgi:NTE family protein
MKLGLTLSGGGFRAAVFHLGMLARLAGENRLEDVSFISTVSGGSLCAGLVYGSNDFVWPTSSQLISRVIPRARELMTTQDLQLGFIWRALQSPLHLFDPKANYLSQLLQQRWGITAQLADLPRQPRWLINSTCYETGKDWRFESFRMGDYIFGYTYDTEIPVSDAVAASSGFPGLIGALVLNTKARDWFKYTSVSPESSDRLAPEIQAQNKTAPIEPSSPQVHLWDGGVYDNFGLEGVFDIENGWRQEIDFLIVSDASGGTKPATYQPGINALLRIISGIMMPQVRALRARSFLERIRNHQDQGAFIHIGNTCAAVLNNTSHKDDIARLSPLCLDETAATLAANTPTAIKRLLPSEFDLLFRHGYEVADYTLYGYYSDQFNFIGFANSPWGKNPQ